LGQLHMCLKLNFLRTKSEVGGREGVAQLNKVERRTVTRQAVPDG
jgi:hypothetical protein